MSKLKTASDITPLSGIDFFTVFSHEALANLEKSATLRKFKKNTDILILGEDSLAAYVLVEGSAYAFIDDQDGRELIVAWFSKGDCFGELGLLDDFSRTTSVKTTSDCQCLVVPKSAITYEIAKDPKVAQSLIHFLVRRIRNMTDDISCLGLMDVYGRVIRALNYVAVVNGDGSRVTSRITHQELASRVGASREMVSKILKDLKAAGFIAIENHSVHILRELPERCG
ncbi:MAG: Crp/Fnr family transcriptional regulator [Granulosicoccus sp.]